jgi:hypothetical protein
MPFRRWKKAREASAPAAEPQEPDGQKRSPPSERVQRMFGFKSAWLAIRSEEPEEVVRALQLREVKPTAWPDGLAAVDAWPQTEALKPVLVCPVVDGWVLCPFSLNLASLEQFDFKQLSRRFGETQRFLSFRITDLYQWERWVDGDLVRRFGVEVDDVLFDIGEPSEDEMQVRLSQPDYGAPRLADEEIVLDIAGRWSINPMTLDDGPSLPVDGWLGGLTER